MIAALFVTAALQVPAAREPVIVVTAGRRGRCRARLADRPLSARQLRALAREWAALGTPVSVVPPAGADYRCLARIAFRLRDRGVRVTHFVRDDDPAAAEAGDLRRD